MTRQFHIFKSYPLYFSVILVSTTLLSHSSGAFVRLAEVSSTCRGQLVVDAITSPLDQAKLDFIGSLDNPYDFNDSNAVSSIFLSKIVDKVSPELVSRNIVESFGELGIGKWRVVYAQKCSTMFGFGSFFGEITSVNFEFGNYGSVTCNLLYRNPILYELSLDGTFGTVKNNVLIKVSNVRSTRLDSSSGSEVHGLRATLSRLQGVPMTIAASILETNWQRILAGVVILDIGYIDESMIVFDLGLLARAKGRRICARKEPDFF